MTVIEYKRDELKPDLLTPEIIESINNQTIYWSDDRCEHWIFDYSLDGVWISSKIINNDLTLCVVELWEEDIHAIKG